MGANSAIEWTDHTFNPWIGCMKVSAGCTHCYAETLNHRWGHDNWGPAATTERRRTAADNWSEPRRWNNAAAKAGVRKRVFCASMADVFEDNPQLVQWRSDLLDLIADTPHLDWLLLTKRPQHVTAMVKAAGHDFLPANVWIGTSVENQQTADERIPHLLEVPATVRFLSCEPLLGPVLFDVCEDEGDAYGDGAIYYNMLTGYRWMRDGIEKELQGTAGIDWVIAGGESGREARPMHPDWARSLRDQCQRAGVAFFMKQMGGTRKKHGDLEDLPLDLRIRAFPRNAIDTVS